VRYFTTEAPKVISKQFDDEVVLANYDSGLYYSLADSGAAIWLALRAGASDQGIVASFTSRFPAASNAERDISAFIEQLLQEGLIASVEKGNETATPSLAQLQEFQPPALERFDDLKELLLLDPVHDVDDAGWPVKAEDAR
jgi:hypothetical protein